MVRLRSCVGNSDHRHLTSARQFTTIHARWRTKDWLPVVLVADTRAELGLQECNLLGTESWTRTIDGGTADECVCYHLPY